ncbi:MAG: MotA/TolQ/ExbB proton channel family protein [Lachnospiraceae bacterium]|nr:MotA/TolQ/ExbB proton channel family protein [Lachnospiraceae bacterium]
MFIGGIVLFLAGILISIMTLNLQVSIFVNVPSLVIFIIACVATNMWGGGNKTFIIGVNALLSKKYHISSADKEKVIRLFKLQKTVAIYMSILSFLIGIISVLANASDIYLLGPMIAMALLAVIYGTLFTTFFHAAVSMLENRYNSEEKAVISEKQVIDKMLELCFKQGVSPEEIISADEINFMKK